MSTRPWAEFTAKLTEHLGSSQRALTNFHENTEYSQSSLQHWRKTNRVPEEAFALIDSIDPEKCVPSTFQGYHNTSFIQRVIELSAKKHTLSSIAEMVSKEFDRHVTENMIKGIRYRNKASIENYQSREVQKND